MIISRVFTFCFLLIVTQGFSQLSAALADWYPQPVTQHWPLNGKWEFYPNELLSIDQAARVAPRQYKEVPAWWSDQSDSAVVRYATYRLRIVLPRSLKKQGLAISMPAVLSAYDLWVNGILIGQNGIVGVTKQSTSPQWRPSTYTFTTDKDTLEIVLHIANFHHARTGIQESILFGTADQLTKKKAHIELLNTILLMGLVILSIGAFIFYKVYRKKGMLLYALFCLSWAFRAAFSNHYQFIQWFPDFSWVIAVKIEYITIYLSTFLGCLLMVHLFPRDVDNKVFPRFILGACTFFTLFTLATPPVIFTQFVQLYTALSVLLLIGILAILVRCYMRNRRGSEIITLAAFLAVIIFGYVILAYEGVFELNVVVYNIAFLFLYAFIGLAVSIRLNKMLSVREYTDVLTYDELITANSWDAK